MAKRLTVLLLLCLLVTPTAIKADDLHLPPDMVGHWAVPAIIKGARWTAGYPDGTWRPDSPITRGELFTLLARALQLSPVSTTTLSEQQSHWAIRQGWIRAALEAGIIDLNDYPDNQPELDQPVTRQELILAALRASGYEDKASAVEPPESTKIMIADLGSIPAGIHGRVQLALCHELIRGYPDGYLRPGAVATRAEALVVATRVVEELVLSHSSCHQR